jgi:hypothetical protein
MAWHHIVIVYPTESLEEAVTRPHRLFCSFDGEEGWRSNRRAKKLARKFGREWIRGEAEGQPRYVKTRVEPFSHDQLFAADPQEEARRLPRRKDRVLPFRENPPPWLDPDDAGKKE